MKKLFILSKKGFTLIEMLIVIVVVSILMTAVMRFGSSRISDLKAQSLKEEFVWYYNNFWSQNMTSSFRDGQRYQKLVISFTTGIWYGLDTHPPIFASQLSSLTFRDLMLDAHASSTLHLQFSPYMLWCLLTSDVWTLWNIFSFQIYHPKTGKQYCFEIRTETCKLIEKRCTP